MVLTVSEIVRELIHAQEHGKDINLNRYMYMGIAMDLFFINTCLFACAVHNDAIVIVVGRVHSAVLLTPKESQ